MGLDFVPASTGGMGTELEHKTLESQFRFSLLTANDAHFIIEVLLGPDCHQRQSLLRLVLLTSAFFNCHGFRSSSFSSFSFFNEMLIFHFSASEVHEGQGAVRCVVCVHGTRLFGQHPPTPRSLRIQQGGSEGGDDTQRSAKQTARSAPTPTAIPVVDDICVGVFCISFGIRPAVAARPARSAPVNTMAVS
ncbi:hypothetical protein AVEN_189008-1 [Araneus ventricosus]|uniref:Uncharacterized protein n=1 Tax=Araneus ventricosus TaxID=182803 RepID=A0A4Y2SWH5_ARAVE|nr:hypothetical protein AVEN_189008-1 [Araneus ventricosus]